MPTVTDVVMEAVNEAVEHLTGEQITEIGVGLIAKGLFRTKTRQGAKQAADDAQTSVSVISGMHLDFRRAALKEDRP